MSISLYERDAVELDRLLLDLSNTNPSNGRLLQEKRQALLDFKGLTSEEDLKNRAEAAFQASINYGLDRFADHYETVTDQMDDVTLIFTSAANLARAGEQALLLNRLNSFLDRASKTVAAGKEAIEAIRDMGQITESTADDAIVKIETAYNAWEAVVNIIQGRSPD